MFTSRFNNHFKLSLETSYNDVVHHMRCGGHLPQKDRSLQQVSNLTDMYLH